MNSRHIFHLGLILFALAVFLGCSPLEDATPSVPTQTTVTLLGDKFIAYSNGDTIRAYEGTRASTAQEVTIVSQTFHWNHPFDLIAAMPESNSSTVLKYGNVQDYCFKSNGNPFDIVALYSNGSYYHVVNMHYQVPQADGSVKSYSDVIFDDRTLSCQTCGHCSGQGSLTVKVTEKTTCQNCSGHGHVTLSLIHI